MCSLLQDLSGKDGLEEDIVDGYTSLHAYTPANAATISASVSHSSPLPVVGPWADGQEMWQTKLTGWQVLFVR